MCSLADPLIDTNQVYPMKQQSRARGLLRYLGMSVGWLVLMVGWALLVAPHTNPRCYTSASFGFLPAAIVVPFLMLPLYVVSVAVHAVVAFCKQRFEARARDGVSLFGLDAAFFIPFALVSLIALISATHWDRSLHCFLMTFAVALPWTITPVVNARLLAWKA